ncbi:MAG: hypothetical protein K2X77_33930 [Candidatus Obscuribacterales bacterium]|jgi:RNA polymerase subunit RPABC4/transcription elongation factor Spt4|nr:hypothetical protein [Candidatus Obscuribacterales bacterium]
MADACPYCGTLLTTSLRFCVNCRRSVTENKISIVNLHDEEEEAATSKKYKLSRKSSYDIHRQVRTFFFTSSTLLMLVISYYYAMKAINQPVPGDKEIAKILKQIQAQIKK